MKRLTTVGGLIVALIAAAPAGSVGLGPLVKQGLTDSADKGFYLTIYNPYKEHADFMVYAIGKDDETASQRVRIPTAQIPLASLKSRKFLIVATGLIAGESYTFRVCAERIFEKDQMIHARVCSRLTARRVVLRPDAGVGSD